MKTIDKFKHNIKQGKFYERFRDIPGAKRTHSVIKCKLLSETIFRFDTVYIFPDDERSVMDGWTVGLISLQEYSLKELSKSEVSVYLI